MKLYEIKILRESHNLSDYRYNMETMLRKTNFLFRGMKSHNGVPVTDIPDIDMFVMKPRESDRVPLGNALAFAISQTWDDLPNRSRSAFATGKQDATISFGSPYLCIPRDNTKSFGCIDKDFNFTDGEKRISTMNYKLGYLFSISKRVIGGESFKGNEAAQKLKTALDSVKVDSRNRPLYAHPNTLAVIQQLVDSAPDIFDESTEAGKYIIQDSQTIKREMEKLGVTTLPQLLDSFPPEEFGITHATSLADIPKDIGEVWWEGEYLIIDMGDNTPTEILQHLINEIG